MLLDGVDQLIFNESDECMKIILGLAYPEIFKVDTKNLCFYAAAYGYLDILIWANADVQQKYNIPKSWRERNNYNFSWNCSITVVAARYGHLDILIWTKDQDYELVKNGFSVMSTAAKGDHFHVLKWLAENGCQLFTCISEYAATNGNLEILKWCEDNNKLLKDFCYNAAGSGHLEVLKWAKSRGYEHRAYYTAAYYGRLEVLDWAMLNNDFDSDKIYFGAIQGNRLEVMGWAKANKLPLDLEICQFGHKVESVDRWLSKNGCVCGKY